MSERRQRALIWRMIRKYQMPDGYAFLALTLLKFNGLMSAARYCWHYRCGSWVSGKAPLRVTIKRSVPIIRFDGDKEE